MAAESYDESGCCARSTGTEADHSLALLLVAHVDRTRDEHVRSQCRGTQVVSAGTKPETQSQRIVAVRAKM